MITIHNTHQTKHQTHSIFRTFKFCVLFISYTRLFTKLNLFEILLYITFLTTKFSRLTAHIMQYEVYYTCLYTVVLTNSLIACSTGGSSSGDDNNTGAIVGGVFGGLCGAILLIVLIILIWFYWKRERGEKDRRASTFVCMEHMCKVLCIYV